MKACYQQSYGTSDVLLNDDSLPVPTPRDGDLLVKIRYASINPIDFHMRGGYGRQIMERKRETLWPLVLGRDGVGEVVELGASVKGYNIGDLVVFAIGPEDQGSCAQYCRVPHSAAATVPEKVDIRDAASIAYVALTTWRALVGVAGLEPGNCRGQRILVHAGAGGVGSFAIQLLKLWGASVVTTCSEANIEKVKSLGADLVIDYKTQQFEDLAGPVDGVLDTVGFDYERRSLRIVSQGGFYVSVVTPLIINITEKGLVPGLLRSAFTFIGQKVHCRRKNIRYGWSLFEPNGEALSYVMKCLSEGKIAANIDRQFMLDETGDAQQYLESGQANGKVLVCVS